jgi:predicted ABC-type transport system involved in lysophospholipase L1 biosynthesis ATPase subunit
MTDEPALVSMTDVVKSYGARSPFRIRSLALRSSDRVALAGLDRERAELFTHLVSGAALPDAGSIQVAGIDTRTIGTDQEWLLSLDRFGLVSNRSVLLDSMPVAANLALPMTLAIDPIEPAVRSRVEALADDVGLGWRLLDEPAAGLDPLGRLRVHLARALANGPDLLLLEDPTTVLPDLPSREELGRSLLAAGRARGVGWIALTTDATFARASESVVWRLDPESGEVRKPRRWWPWGGTSVA